jgi:hypothetical protein
MVDPERAYRVMPARAVDQDNVAIGTVVIGEAI